jgi:glutathione synthase/RimK-type ligase-like ATP-grasp enzyme
LKQAFEYFNAYAQKAVIKPNEGWQGQDVYLCETVAQVEQALLTIFKQDKNACICPFYPIENEYRVFYVYGECPVAYGKKRPSDSWKHNLTGGATAFDIQDEGLLANLRTLARKAAASINISFATVDIIQLTDGSLLILEINAGVSARKLLEQLPHHKDKIKDLYAQAVGRMFE